MTISSKQQPDKNLPTISYLEFGSINQNSGEKTVWDYRTGETAYDWFMLARYSNDLTAYRRMCRSAEEGDLVTLLTDYAENIHHSDDFSVNLGKFLALSIAGAEEPRPGFFEIGQTLFGCIDAMELCKKVLDKLAVTSPEIDLRQTYWYGLDISPLFNQLAPLLHAGYAVVTDNDMTRLPGSYDLFFAKGVTLLYAVRTIEDIFSLLNKSKLSLFDYSLSLETEQDAVIGTGKPVVYLALAPFMEACRTSGKSLYVKRGNSRVDLAAGRVWLDAVYGSEELCKLYINSDQQVRKSLASRLSGMSAEQMLDTANGRNSGWMTARDFLTEHGLARS